MAHCKGLNCAFLLNDIHVLSSAMFWQFQNENLRKIRTFVVTANLRVKFFSCFCQLSNLSTELCAKKRETTSKQTNKLFIMLTELFLAFVFLFFTCLSLVYASIYSGNFMWQLFFEGPLYLFWKHLHAKVIGLFTHHQKFENQLHVHRKKQAITFHVKMQIIFSLRKTYLTISIYHTSE